MTQSIRFTKLSGSGNDFVCLDNRDGRFDETISSSERIGHFARALCHRGSGLGADGIVFACRSEVPELADIEARFFEADGSEAELCGNGIACFTHWVIDSNWVRSGELKILTPTGVVRGQNGLCKYVRVCIPDPEDIRRDMELEINGVRWKYDYAVTGVPHVITYVDDVDEVEIHHWGPGLRSHPSFAPRGANANFVQVLGEGKIAVRTWEFGVEGETLSCGTGSAAAAILAFLRFNWPCKYLCGDEAIEIKARSGDVLRVYFVRRDDGTITDVCLETIVRCIYSGELCAEMIAVALPGPTGQTD